MQINRRTNEATSERDRDQDADPRDPHATSKATSPPLQLDSQDDPLRGMSDGDVLQRLEMI